MTTLSAIHHVGIVVENIEASTAWYVEKLGFEPLYTLGPQVCRRLSRVG